MRECRCSAGTGVPALVPDVLCGASWRAGHAVNISIAISTEASGGQPQGSHGSHIENVITTGL
jgi:hypothetical protein